MALVARSADDLGKVASGLRNDPVLIPSDLADPDAPAAVAAAAIEALGPVDVLVNNAGAGVRTDSTDLDAETIDRLLTLNVRNLLLLTIGLLPPMLERGRGSVINVSSVSSQVGTPRRSAYAASKGAVDAMTRRWPWSTAARRPGERRGPRGDHHLDVGTQPDDPGCDRAGRGPDRPSAVGPARRRGGRGRVPGVGRFPLSPPRRSRWTAAWPPRSTCTAVRCEPAHHQLEATQGHRPLQGLRPVDAGSVGGPPVGRHGGQGGQEGLRLHGRRRRGHRRRVREAPRFPRPGPEHGRHGAGLRPRASRLDQRHVRPRRRGAVDILCDWIEESYRAIAPKKLVAELDGRAATDNVRRHHG